MATLREIKRRISGVQSTQKITKAMKMVAAAKLRRAQDAVIGARPYAKALRALLQHMASRVDVTAHPLFTERPVKRVLLVAISSDRGLCGAFNANIIRATIARSNEQYGDLVKSGSVDLICVGRKCADFFTKNGYQVTQKHIGIIGQMDFEKVRLIADDISKGFLAGRYDRVEVVYNEFKSIIHQRLVSEQILPIPKSSLPEGKETESPVDYIYEPSKTAILESLVPRHFRFQLWHMFLESNAAEQGARMTAMDNATTNATDLIRTLQLSYNKARQASITKELLEIVSGAEALKGTG
jgi:F-type H+-transporting ATPase subunit gamma